ncbi:hypothetical protein FBBAL38_04910 [Flavobacteria bacterium BAL38]|nr:hypothetical protein FBBAL38_04910 [Flavobacteria bacterium BAL38]
MKNKFNHKIGTCPAELVSASQKGLIKIQDWFNK